ncbi:MAG: HAMP domain-containing histidine kinase [Sulfurovum sp.]|nr:HAMP domain-containing histidine kinase [Sulfurovum sp.]
MLCRNVDNSFTLCDTESKEEKKHYVVTSLPSEFKQVLLNLISNAKDAIEQIKNPKDLELKISVYLSQKDDEVHIDICDNAGGIDENTVKRIFEPYFTTKEMGTGLGLFIVKTLLKKHFKGDIYCENRENEIDGVTYKGTAFCIVLPKIIDA